MELQARIEKVEGKIERVEAKQERVEQALEGGTAYLGTSDHVSLAAAPEHKGGGFMVGFCDKRDGGLLVYY